MTPKNTPPPTAQLTTHDGKRTFLVDNRPYQELQTLGNTNTNHTFLVQGPEHKAVVKSLHERLTTSDNLDNPKDRSKTLELFLRESDTLSRLQHPQIPRLYTPFQTTEDNLTRFYLLQEYFDAPNLETIIRSRTKLPPQEAIAIILSALTPLEYMHAQQPPLIHRDIKPANILWNGIEAKVVDLGSVTDTTQHQPDSLGLGSSTIAGTKGYIAPEQWLGHASPQSDIYSLGATLLRLITGANIENLYDDKAASFDKCFAISYKEKYGSKIDPSLQTILATSLAFDAEKRYPSVTEFRSALEQYLETPPTKTTKTVSGKKKNEAQQALIAIAGACTFVGLVMTGALIYESKHYHTLAENEVAVLVDEKGVVTEDLNCKKMSPLQKKHDETIFEYISPAKLALPLTINAQNNASYPLYTILGYQIKNPAELHTIMTMYDRGEIDGFKVKHQYPPQEKLKLYLQAFLNNELALYFTTHPLETTTPAASEFEIDPLVTHIRDAFEAKLPKSLEYLDFNWTKGIPQPQKR